MPASSIVNDINIMICVFFWRGGWLCVLGATVQLECKNRTNLQVLYSAKTTTDSRGVYNFVVEKDQQDQMCSCNLEHSPDEECGKADPGRKQATAVLTADNGVVNKFHKVNSMGYLKKQTLPVCKQLRTKYFASEM